MNPLAAVFGTLGNPVGFLTRLALLLRGGAPAAACSLARARARRGDHIGAAAVLRRALAEHPHDLDLAFAVGALSRYGFTPFAEAEALFEAVRDAPDARPALRRAAHAALFELVWERRGADAGLARALLSQRRLRPATVLRAAAALVAAGHAEEGVAAALRLGRRTPAALARTGHLDLLCALRASGGDGGLVHAEAAARLSDALADAEGLFDRLVAEGPRGVALVANGPGLSGLGAVIEAHRLVVRFNAFPDAPTDHGRRTDVWMRPHDDTLVPLRTVPGLRLVVATGCDLRARFADAAPRLAKLLGLGAALAVVPTGLYRRLFARLEAAPSVGLIGLAWAAEAAGGPLDAASAFGYALQRNSSSVSRYHDRVVVGRRPGRHNWPAEHAMSLTLLSGPVTAA